MTQNDTQKFARFGQLYAKFKAGQKWLDDRKAAGLDVQQDTDDFCANVVTPLHEIWKDLTDAERREVEQVMDAYDRLGGKGVRFTPEAAPAGAGEKAA